jgi:Zn-finger nucleic acid-binding protein
MKCPKCENQVLKATKIEQGLSAMGCGMCGGASVTLLYYRDWLERTPLDSRTLTVQTKALEEVENDDSKSAMCCPKCSRLMGKFKISGESNNRLDLCSSCDEVWLDGGEWELLKSLEMSNNMPLVFTEQWQNKLRKQATQQAREERLLKIISSQDLDTTKEFKQWLDKHPQRESILFFLNQE